MLDLEFLLGVLEDYCELQESGIVEPANRFAVADVRQQVEFIEKLETTSVEVMVGADELKLARTVMSHRAKIIQLQHQKETLEARVNEFEKGNWKIVPSKATRRMMDAMSIVEEDGYWAMYEAAIKSAPSLLN